MKRYTHTREQQGFVAIIVAMILIALISLIALGFAFLVRQNQRSALNRQLSTQAFYAAESGVNDVVKNLDTVGSINDCSQTASIGGQPNLDGENVKYTCVLVNKAPDTLVYDAISTNESTIANVKSANGESIESLQVSWQDSGAEPNTGFAAASANFQLPQVPTMNNCSAFPGCNQDIADFPKNIGMLRTTIIPATTAGSTASKTVFMYPQKSSNAHNGSTVSFNGNDGVFALGQCNPNNTTPRQCTVTINDVPSPEFYLRLKAIYKPVAVTITAKNSSGAVIPISGAQVVVDSTGRAQDVVRRIQVRVPLAPAYYFPEFGVESATTICKRMASYTGGPSVIGADRSIYSGSSNNESADVAACALQM